MQFAHSLLSGALLLFPVAVTVAIYIGLNIHQIFHTGFKGSYGIPIQIGTKFGTTTYCQKSIGITPQNKRYTCKFVPAVASPLSDVFSLACSVVGLSFILAQNFSSRKVGASIRIRLQMDRARRVRFGVFPIPCRIGALTEDTPAGYAKDMLAVDERAS
jgi:hypothetical protein